MASYKNFFRKSGEILVASARNFITDDCYTKASTLTFYTIQSIVPFLALVFGIAKGFGFENFLKSTSSEFLQQQKEVIGYATEFALETLKNIQGGVIVGFGVMFLIWTTVNLLGYIEHAFNEIWKIETPRTFFRKFSDYLAFVILCPLFIVISSSLTIFIKAQITHFGEYALPSVLNEALQTSFNLVPWILSWIIFFILYYFMPNSKTRVWPKVIAAIFAGSIFQLWQILYIFLQVKVFNYNAIYGAFAALPLFFIWVQFSWLIALAGAEVAAHIENDFFINLRGKGEKVTNHQFGVLILHFCLKRFYEGKAPLIDREISALLKSKLDITQKMLGILVEGKLLSQTSDTGGYQPLSDPHGYTIKQVYDAINHHFDYDIVIEASKQLHQVLDKLKKLEQSEEKLETNIPLNEIVTG